MMARSAIPSPETTPPSVRFVQLGGVAFRVNTRVLGMIGLALVVLVALGAWALTLGSFRLPLQAVIDALTGAEAGDARFIVRDLRLPRVLTAAFVGAALAMSGAIFQGLVRNPLVSPDIIGVNAGASFAAVFWIVTGQPSPLLPVIAFTGAVATTAAIYLLSWRGNIAGPRLILVGIGVNAILTALTTGLVVRANIYEASRALHWTTGSVYAATWGDVRVVAAVLAVLVPVGVALMWALRVIQVGDTTARSVGLPLERTRLALVLVGCALSAGAVAVAGPIGFVALMVPHIARMIAGPMSGSVFIVTGVLGALLVLGADMVGQHALPVGVPVGVVTGAVGAPYFLFLMYRANTRV
ncbi:FecCD family ABC transporter permease [Sphaerobacter thermophilus]|uniref:Transport system permease protein n=1 Tax=Sphaerobacter thermophilus (strain ATCC 49802 / DSM 20745 / KCCM 41009 / NCIMB 13125 / S 6022) TaxID=479434 RepID=D1C855_SPHTD|nr:iron ABC transporter permease [Sphaerobacter thermophilus]ACZ39998.1 transport system permease protein [Sphaerobacter thermophilus DSM 20745]